MTASIVSAGKKVTELSREAQKEARNEVFNDFFEVLQKFLLENSSKNKNYLSELQKRTVKDLTLIADSISKVISSEFIKECSLSSYVVVLTFSFTFLKQDAAQEYTDIFQKIAFDALKAAYEMKAATNNDNLFHVYLEPVKRNKRAIYIDFENWLVCLNDELFGLVIKEIDEVVSQQKCSVRELLIEIFPNLIEKQLSTITNEKVEHILTFLFTLIKHDDEVSSRIGDIRKMWCIMRDDKAAQRKMINMLSEYSATAKNVSFTYIYLMFLFDMYVQEKQAWERAFSECKNDIALIKFSQFVAVYYWMFLFSVDEKELASIKKSPNSAKALSQERRKFIEQLDVFLNSPFEYGTKLFDDDKLTEYFDFDQKMNYPPQSNEFINTILQIQDTRFHLGFLKTLLKITTIFPPNVSRKPVSSIYPKTLPVLLNSVHHINCDSNILSLMKDAFNNATNWRKFDANVFGIWEESLLLNAFCSDKEIREVVQSSLANYIQLSFPNTSILIPVFLFLSTKLDTVNYVETLNAIASIESTQVKANAKKTIAFLKPKIEGNNDIDAELFNEFLEFKCEETNAVLDLLYKSAKGKDLTVVFNGLLQILLEKALHKKETSELEKIILSRITEVSFEDLMIIPQLAAFDSLIPSFLESFVACIINAKKIELVPVALELVINSQIDYSKELEALNDINFDKATNETRMFLKEFLAYYKRYPFKNGVVFADSIVNIYNTNKSSDLLEIIGDDETLTSIKTEENRGIFNTFTNTGRIAYSIPFKSNEKKQRTAKVSKIEASEISMIKAMKEPYEILFDSLLSDVKVDKHEEEQDAPLNDEAEQKQQVSDIISTLGIDGGLISYDSNSERAIKFFFQQFPRATHKIGIVYVGEEQRDQNTLLGNTTASHDFYSFINGIGYTVDMMKHVGFTGGLTALKEGTGPTSIYYADAINEVMYHVSTLMTSNQKDSQNIYKKRHIGNDNVHIIWSQDSEEYDNEMIISQFNHGHVIVYPSSSKKRVIFDVRSKKDVGVFGILSGKSTVSIELASSFARITSIEANKVARKQTAASKFNKITDDSFKTIIEKSGSKDTLYLDLLSREAE